MAAIEVGVKGTYEKQVVESDLASSVGSGDVPVFSTPMLLAIMEGASVNAIKSFLKPEETSVGTSANFSHLAATPIGLKVRAEATVSKVDGRKVSFQVVAFDDKEKIGEGTHERFILNKEKFVKKAQEKSK